MSESAVANQQNHVQPWRKTIAEVYDAIYCKVREALKSGAIVPCRLDNGNHVYLLCRPEHIRQVASPTEVQIRTESGWIYILPETADEWARTFDVVGPTEYMAAVEKAIKEDYPVPKEIQRAHKALLVQAKGKEVKRAQLTRTIDESGLPVQFDGLEKPVPGDTIYYSNRPLLIKTVLSYLTVERMWTVDVFENEYRFTIQRQINVMGDKEWVVYIRNK